MWLPRGTSWADPTFCTGTTSLAPPTTNSAWPSRMAHVNTDFRECWYFPGNGRRKGKMTFMEPLPWARTWHPSFTKSSGVGPRGSWPWVCWAGDRQWALAFSLPPVSSSQERGLVLVSLREGTGSSQRQPSQAFSASALLPPEKGIWPVLRAVEAPRGELCLGEAFGYQCCPGQGKEAHLTQGWSAGSHEPPGLHMASCIFQ